MQGITEDEAGAAVKIEQKEVTPADEFDGLDRYETTTAMITVDIDEPYSEWTRENLPRMRKTIYRVPGVKSAFIRKSSGGNVHIRVHLDREISMFESFLLRAHFGDDAARLACDLDRFYRTGKLEDTGRTFDQKYTRGTIRYAGKWLRF